MGRTGTSASPWRESKTWQEKRKEEKILSKGNILSIGEALKQEGDGLDRGGEMGERPWHEVRIKETVGNGAISGFRGMVMPLKLGSASLTQPYVWDNLSQEVAATRRVSRH